MVQGGVHARCAWRAHAWCVLLAPSPPFALALVVETRFDAGPDDRAAFAARAAVGCDGVETVDVKKYVALAKPRRGETGANARETEANARGALQRAMSAFLEKCPRGVAVITDAQSLTPPLLAALMPAVSEGGRFARDGRNVRADGATYVLIAALGADFSAGEGGTWRARGPCSRTASAPARATRRSGASTSPSSSARAATAARSSACRPRSRWARSPTPFSWKRLGRRCRAF